MIKVEESINQLRKQSQKEGGHLYRVHLQKSYLNKSSNQLKNLKSILDESINQVIEGNKSIIEQVYANQPAERFETDEVLYTHNVNGENIGEYFDVASKEESGYGVLTKQLNQTDLKMNNTLLVKQQQNPMLVPTSPFQSANKENSYAKKYLSKKKKNSGNFDLPLRKEGAAAAGLNDSSISQKFNIKNL